MAEASERTYREYPRDVRIVEVVDDYGERYQFEAPMHESVEFEAPSLAELYADVYFDVGGFREEKSGDRGVPPTVAMAGKDTVVAYLVTQRGMGITWASRMFDLSEDSIRTYLSRVRRRAEQRRDEIDDVDDQDEQREPVDDDRRDDVNGDPVALEDEVRAIVDELDLPGGRGALEARRDAVMACWRYLRDQGEATKSDFVDDVYPDEGARYGSPGGWWNTVGKRGLRTIADEHRSVDAPIEGNHVWFFVDE